MKYGMRYRIPLLAATVATVLAMTAGSAFALFINGTLDSSQTVNTASPALEARVLPAQLAQTFTPTLTGSLGTVQLYTLYPLVPAVDAAPNVTDVSVQIFATDVSGNPTGPALATQTATTADGGWTTVVFGTPTNVSAGTKYALVMSGAATPEWLGTCGNEYGPGAALILDTTWKTIPTFNDAFCITDFAFQAYIVVAAPASTPTPTPAPTVPPTSTSNSGSGSGPTNPSSLLILAGLSVAAAAAVVVAISRRRVTQQ